MRRISGLFLAILLSCGASAQTIGLPQPATTTDRHSTIASGGAFQSVLAFNQNRLGCTVQNPNNATEDLYVYFGPLANATQAGSVDLAKGQAASCNNGTIVLIDQVSVMGATGGHAFTFNSQP